MIDCSICGQKIPQEDIEIQAHLIRHEQDWIDSLKRRKV
jgi:hypothetical protein